MRILQNPQNTGKSLLPSYNLCLQCHYQRSHFQPYQRYENITSIGKLPDLVSKQPSNNNSEVGNDKGNKINTEPKETFNVEPLSIEEEMDAVDALLSLSTLRDDSVDQLMENKILMPIGGGNLQIDAAPVPLELDQAQVDHAIAKMT